MSGTKIRMAGQRVADLVGLSTRRSSASESAPADDFGETKIGADEPLVEQQPHKRIIERGPPENATEG